MTIQSQFPASRPSLLLDFANSKRLDPRVTFTRASTARFYDGTTVAKAEENLFTRSAAFDDAAWLKLNTTIAADQTTAPDGTSTADLLAEAANSGIHGLQRDNNIPIVSGLTYTWSVFLKKGTGATAPDVMQLNFAFATFGTMYGNFNLSTGTVGTTSGAITASIVNAGGGWYRCIVTATATASGNTSTAATLAFTNNNDALGRNPTYTGATTADVFVWGAQLEERSAVTAYTPTTTAPITNYIPVLQTAASGQARFDHNPVTGESLGLFIEESRTNLALRSEEFTSGLWGKTDTTVTDDAAVAPNGTLTADKYIPVSGDVDGNIQQSISTTDALAYTFSFYAKAGEQSVIGILSNLTGTFRVVSFNLSTGVATGTTGWTASMTAVGNGWYRCAGTATASTTTTRVFALSINGLGVTGNGYNGCYIWGAQVEAGAFPTSYIQTTTASATRQADAASMTGANFTSWYETTEGTLYVEADTIPYNSALTGALVIAEANDGTTGNTFGIRYDAGGTNTSGYMFVNGTNQGSLAVGTATTGFNRIAQTFSSGTRSFTKDASAVQAGTYTIPPVVSRFSIGSNGALTTWTNGTIRKISYYPVRLPDAQLQALTR